MNRKLRMGMVGGGTDAFIGAIHRHAALLDNQIELVCGCFSVDPKFQKNRVNFIIYPMIVYMKHIRKCSKETKLPEGEKWILFRSSHPILSILNQP